MNDSGNVTALAPGGKARLDGTEVRVDVTNGGAPVAVALLGADGRARPGSELLTADAPARDGVRIQDGIVRLDLARVPADVHGLAVLAGADPVRTPGGRLVFRVVSAAGTLTGEPPAHPTGTAVLAVRVVRDGGGGWRKLFGGGGGGWAVHADGQGFPGGLPPAAQALGLPFAAPAPGFPAAPPAGSAPQPPAGFPTAPPPGRTGGAAGRAPGGAPAISLDKVQRAAPGLVSLYKQAGVSLE